MFSAISLQLFEKFCKSIIEMAGQNTATYYVESTVNCIAACLKYYGTFM